MGMKRSSLLYVGLPAWACLAFLAALPLAGCEAILPPPPAPLFSVPLSVEGRSVGSALVDTGGGFEVMLRDSYGLNVVDNIDVLAFAGRSVVPLTEGFEYTAGGISASANTAIIGNGICGCNGLGFPFFRKTGVVLGIDFDTLQASFHATVPGGGTTIVFALPPPQLIEFDTSFIDVVLSSGGELTVVRALLDTGAAISVLRRDIVGTPSLISSNRIEATIHHESLGTIVASITLFEGTGLPDLILGTDVMRAWAPQWYFSFTQTGGTVTVFPEPSFDVGLSAVASVAR